MATQSPEGLPPLPSHLNGRNRAINPPCKPTRHPGYNSPQWQRGRKSQKHLAWSRTSSSMEPRSKGLTTARKKKPKELAVITECCTGCAGSPACVEYCPVEDCMFWIEDDDHPPFGRIEVDPILCIGCKKCVSKGPEGCFLRRLSLGRHRHGRHYGSGKSSRPDELLEQFS